MTPENLAIINESTAERVGRIVPLSEIKSPVVLGGLALWNELRGARALPARSEITPRRFAKYLRYITLFAVHEGGNDVEFRIMGDAAVMAFGGSFRGLRREALNRIQPGMGDVMSRLCGHVARTRAPLSVKGWFRQGRGAAFYQEAVFLPLGENEAEVGYVLGIGDYTPAPPQELAR